MVDDLVHNVLEPGMSYRRIRVLLGRPDVDLLSQMRYLLGDSETLVLDLPGLKYQRAEIRNED